MRKTIIFGALAALFGLGVVAQAQQANTPSPAQDKPAVTNQAKPAAPNQAKQTAKRDRDGALYHREGRNHDRDGMRYHREAREHRHDGERYHREGRKHDREARNHNRHDRKDEDHGMRWHARKGQQTDRDSDKGSERKAQ